MKDLKYSGSLYFFKNEPISIEHKNLVGIAELIMSFDIHDCKQPFFITCDDEMYIYDRKLYSSFLKHGNCSQFLEETQIDGFYRNKKSITINGIELDPGSLWYLKGNVLVLVDDDQHVETPFDSIIFTKLIQVEL